MKDQFKFGLFFVVFAFVLFKGVSLQGQNDTVWGTGIFYVFDYTSNISNEEILCTPLQMEGDTIPDTTYIYTTNSQGKVSFTLPVYIDIVSAIPNSYTNDALVVPNPSSDFTFAFHGKALSDLNLYTSNGVFVKKIQINYDESKGTSSAYIDISDEPNGIYLYTAITENGKLGGKICKSNSDISGNHSTELLENNITKVKNSLLWSATYDVSMFVEGYYDYNYQYNITDGDNGTLAIPILKKLDTIWATGLFVVYGQGNVGIINEEIHCTPTWMQGYFMPDTTYIFTTGNAGEVLFKLPVDITFDDNSDSKDNYALYDIHISHEGYYDYYEEMILLEGALGIKTFTLQAPTIPQHQYIGGTVQDEYGDPMPDVTVYIKEQETDILLGDTVTDIDGKYLFANPLFNTDIYFGVGGNDWTYGFYGDKYSVPYVITEWDDTLKDVFNFVLYEWLRPIPDNPSEYKIFPAWKARFFFDAADINMNYGLYDSILYYLKDFPSSAMEDTARQRIDEFSELFGKPGIFKEVDYLLNENLSFPNYDPLQVGINITNTGGGNGYPVQWLAFTPLGNYIHTTIGGHTETPLNQSTFFHELGHCLGLNHQSFPSFMTVPNAPLPNSDDKIALKMAFDHSKNIWEGRAYFTLENLRVSFTNIQPCPGVPTVQDEDGWTYNTVLIGNQCWLNDDLKTGSQIIGSYAATNNGIIEKYCYDDIGNNFYGLYTWDEMMDYTTEEGVQGICPDGWHIPTDDEWAVLEGFADTQYNALSAEWDDFGWRGYDAGLMLKYEVYFNGWNLYGLDIFRNGYRYTGGYDNFFEGYFWTSSTNGLGNPIYRHFNADHEDIERIAETNSDHGYSVRCIKD